MKKLNVLLSLAIIGIFVFPACEKESEKDMQHDLPNQKSSIQSEMSELEIRINRFLDKMENEEEGSLSLDSAVYYLEAGFNYRYSNSGRIEDLSVTQFDTSFVDIQVDSDNMCSYSSMNESYGNIYTQMESIFDTLSSDDGKALKIVDIGIVQDEDIKLRLISFWKSDCVPFAGDWVWGLKGGRCDGAYQGQLDATDAIQGRYEHKYSPSSFGIWHNIDVTGEYYAHELLMTQNAPTNPFGYNTSLLFHYHTSSGMPPVCLLHDEIGFYVDRVPEVINRIKNDQGISAQVINIDIGDDMMATGQNPYPIVHTARLIYGSIEIQRVKDPLGDFILH